LLVRLGYCLLVLLSTYAQLFEIFVSVSMSILQENALNVK